MWSQTLLLMGNKKLQSKSKYAQYDIDGDGVVTDEELGQAKEIRETERDLRKSLAQLRMARFTLIGMGYLQRPCLRRGYQSKEYTRFQRFRHYSTFRALA